MPKDVDSPKIFIGQIPRHFDIADLRTLLQDFGQIAEINVLRDRATGQSKGLYLPNTEYHRIEECLLSVVCVCWQLLCPVVLLTVCAFELSVCRMCVRVVCPSNQCYKLYRNAPRPTSVAWCTCRAVVYCLSVCLFCLSHCIVLSVQATPSTSLGCTISDLSILRT
jgi:hypothetical protein